MLSNGEVWVSIETQDGEQEKSYWLADYSRIEDLLADIKADMEGMFEEHHCPECEAHEDS